MAPRPPSFYGLLWLFPRIAVFAPQNKSFANLQADQAETFVGSFVPTSGFAVSGPGLTSDGLGLRNTIVTLTGPNGFVRQATTSSFGFYQFLDIPPSQTYTVRVASRLFRFAPQTFQVNGNMLNVDFIGQE